MIEVKVELQFMKDGWRAELIAPRGTRGLLLYPKEEAWS